MKGHGTCLNVGAPTKDGRMIAEASWAALPIAITIAPPDEDKYVSPTICGKVTNIEVKNGGEFHAVVDINDDFVHIMDIVGGEWFMQAEVDQTGDPVMQTTPDNGEMMVFPKARLRGIRLGKHPAWDNTVLTLER